MEEPFQPVAESPVLVLAGIELTFCRVAGMLLSFYFVPKIVLITPGCFSCCCNSIKVEYLLNSF